MARISEKNKRFREKTVICDDLEIILKSNLHYGTKFAVISEVIWVWSEFDGKHKGCQFWSKKAIKSGLVDKGLIHEHIFPRKLLTEKLFEKPWNSKELLSFLEAYCVGVVVTKDEDNALNNLGLNSKMPEDWDNKDPWARYKKIHLTVINTKTNKLIQF